MEFETPCTCDTLRRATRAITAAYDAALAPSGLRITQFGILRIRSLSFVQRVEAAIRLAVVANIPAP
jgi:hypothetical protein